MLVNLIRWSIKNRVFVLVMTLLLSGWGLLSVKQTPLDAIPDLSDIDCDLFPVAHFGIIILR